MFGWHFHILVRNNFGKTAIDWPRIELNNPLALLRTIVGLGLPLFDQLSLIQTIPFHDYFTFSFPIVIFRSLQLILAFISELYQDCISNFFIMKLLPWKLELVLNPDFIDFLFQDCLFFIEAIRLLLHLTDLRAQEVFFQKLKMFWLVTFELVLFQSFFIYFQRSRLSGLIFL